VCLFLNINDEVIFMKKVLALTWKIICAQFASIFLSFMFMILLGNLTDKMGITNICLILIWFGAIYSVGWNKGKKDSRKITGVKPDVKSNALAGLLCSGVTFVFLLIRIAAFHIAAGGNVENNPGILVASDIIYRLWNFPYISFMQSGTLLAYSVPVLFQFVVYTISYMIGLKRFSIIDNILPKVLYKKKYD